MKKKFFVYLLTLALLASCPNTVCAEDISVEEMEEYLIDNGIPYDYLNDKDDAYITRMYDKLYGIDFIYHGSETVTMSVSDPSGNQVYGTIPEDELEFTITRISNVSYDSSAGMNRVNEVYVDVEYSWIVGEPYVRKEDAITVNWDSSVFTYQEDSFYAVDKKYLVSEGDWIISDEYSRPSQLAQGGLGYFTNLYYAESIAGVSVNAQRCKGEATFTLEPKDPMYQVSGESVTSINAEYVHDFSTPIFSLSFATPDGYSISVEVPIGGTDSATCSVNYYYMFE